MSNVERISRHSSQPSIFGIITSMTARSTLTASSFDESLDSIYGFDHVETIVLQKQAGQLPNVRIIINNKYSAHKNLCQEGTPIV